LDIELNYKDRILKYYKEITSLTHKNNYNKNNGQSDIKIENLLN